MLFLMFRVGKDRYVLDVEQVEQVLPFVEVKALPGAPDGVAGMLRYRGEPVPLLDLSQLALGRPSAPALSTRVIVIRYADAAGVLHRLGLLAERVVETIERDPADFVPSGLEAGTPAYLGPIASDTDGLIQRIRAEALLPPEIRAILFRPVAAAP